MSATARSEVPATKPQPVLVFGSVITALTFLFGGLGVGGVGSETEVLIWVGALGTLITGALNQGLTHYTKGQVVPFQDVGAFLNEHREAVPGPAAREIEHQQVEDPNPPAEGI